MGLTWSWPPHTLGLYISSVHNPASCRLPSYTHMAVWKPAVWGTLKEGWEEYYHPIPPSFRHNSKFLSFPGINMKLIQGPGGVCGRLGRKVMASSVKRVNLVITYDRLNRTSLFEKHVHEEIWSLVRASFLPSFSWRWKSFGNNTVYDRMFLVFFTCKKQGYKIFQPTPHPSHSYPHLNLACWIIVMNYLMESVRSYRFHTSWHSPGE